VSLYTSGNAAAFGRFDDCSAYVHWPVALLADHERQHSLRCSTVENVLAKATQCRRMERQRRVDSTDSWRSRNNPLEFVHWRTDRTWYRTYRSSQREASPTSR